MRIAALDIGSNTVKITVYDRDGQNLRETGRKSVPAGLLSHIREGNLTPQGVEILENALAVLLGYAKECGCDAVYPFATASLRSAANAGAVIGQIRADTGLSVDLIDGNREAELTFRSFLAGNPDAGDGTLLDMGGGSTEMIAFEGGRIVRRISMPFGALFLHNRFVKNILPAEDEAARMAAFVRDALDGAGFPENPGQIWLNGGSGKCLALLKSDPAPLPCRLDRDRMEELCRKIIGCDPEVKALLLRKIPERIHTVPAALIALLVIMDRAGAGSLTVTDAGVREGYLLDLLDRLDRPDRPDKTAQPEGKA